jgi:hypothetical protein
MFKKTDNGSVNLCYVAVIELSSTDIVENDSVLAENQFRQIHVFMRFMCICSYNRNEPMPRGSDWAEFYWHFGNWLHTCKRYTHDMYFRVRLCIIMLVLKKKPMPRGSDWAEIYCGK